jgi:hypothetical protein
MTTETENSSCGEDDVDLDPGGEDLTPSRPTATTTESSSWAEDEVDFDTGREVEAVTNHPTMTAVAVAMQGLAVAIVGAIVAGNESGMDGLLFRMVGKEAWIRERRIHNESGACRWRRSRISPAILLRSLGWMAVAAVVEFRGIWIRGGRSSTCLLAPSVPSPVGRIMGAADWNDGSGHAAGGPDVPVPTQSAG